MGKVLSKIVPPLLIRNQKLVNRKKIGPCEQTVVQGAAPEEVQAVVTQGTKVVQLVAAHQQ